MQLPSDIGLPPYLVGLCTRSVYGLADPGGQVLILINILDTFFIDIDLVLFIDFFQYELKNHIFTKNIFFIDFNIDFKY